MVGTKEVCLFNPESCPTGSVLHHFTDGEIEAQRGEPRTRCLSLQLFAVGLLRPCGSMASQGLPFRKSWGDAGSLDTQSPCSPSLSMLLSPMGLLLGAESRVDGRPPRTVSPWAWPAGSALLIEPSRGTSLPATPAACPAEAVTASLTSWPALGLRAGSMTGQRGAGMERVPGIPTRPTQS